MVVAALVGSPGDLWLGRQREPPDLLTYLTYENEVRQKKRPNHHHFSDLLTFLTF
jgi:hypothetical protein